MCSWRWDSHDLSRSLNEIAFWRAEVGTPKLASQRQVAGFQCAGMPCGRIHWSHVTAQSLYIAALRCSLCLFMQETSKCHDYPEGNCVLA